MGHTKIHKNTARPGNGLREFLATAGACLALVTCAAAQEPETPAPPPAPPTEQTGDYGGLLTPRGSVKAYFDAVEEGDFAKAAEHLDLRNLPRAYRSIPPERLAEMLAVVLERKLWIDLDELSSDPEGKSGDGLPDYRDELGRIEDDGKDYVLLLQRIPVVDGGRVWKVSNATVAQVGQLYEQFGYGPITEAIARTVPDARFMGIELFKWIVTLCVGLAAYPVAVLLGLFLARLSASSGSPMYPRVKALFLGPFTVLIVLFAVHSALVNLGVGVTGQKIVQTRTLTTIAGLWFLLTATGVLRDVYAQRLRRLDREGAIVLLRPATSVVRILIVVIAVLVWLDNAGYNITTLIAGLGVGGIAMALALQKPLEDVFGALTIYTQQPVRVGDYCRIGPDSGTVEEIGLRTTRIRTLANTLISVPNHRLAAEVVDNYSAREKFLYNPVVRLRVDTTPEQIEQVLAGVRELFETHERVIKGNPRIRFQNIGVDALELMVLAYVDAKTFAEYLEVAEELNVGILGIVTRAGTRLALPGQNLYLESAGEAGSPAVQAPQGNVAGGRPS